MLLLIIYESVLDVVVGLIVEISVGAGTIMIGDNVGAVVGIVDDVGDNVTGACVGGRLNTKSVKIKTEPALLVPSSVNAPGEPTINISLCMSIDHPNILWYQSLSAGVGPTIL